MDCNGVSLTGGAHKRARSPDPAGNHTAESAVSIVPELECERTRREPRVVARRNKNEATSTRRATIRT